MPGRRTGGGSGCAVGDGTGQVAGTISTTQCTFSPDQKLSGPFDLSADFFAAEPIDADPLLAPGFPANQMVIRVQHSGARLENANALIFWVVDSAKVARCMRGASPGGVPEWDASFCDRTVLGPNGEGRLTVGMTQEAVSSFFVLNASCPLAYLSAQALGACTNPAEDCPDVTLCPGRGSWITFSHYGNVSTDLTAPIGAGFKVNDGERIAARIGETGTGPAFHVELCDLRTVGDALDRVFPVTAPRIVGTLEGFFDFKLERGQAGQPFP